MHLKTQPTFLTTIWLLVGLATLVGNIITTFIIWRRKARQEKSRTRFGVKCHAAYNLLGINIAYFLGGLTLTITSILRWSKYGEMSDVACDVFGFVHSFSYHFAFAQILVLQTDKLYCLVKPFAYHAYSRAKSKIPFLTCFGCTVYATLIAILPLTKPRRYSSAYTNYVLTWNQDGALYVRTAFSIIMSLLTIAVIAGTFRQKWKLVQKRREMKVATSHPNETILFVLATSSLFLICWLPNLIAMSLTTFCSEHHLGEEAKAVLFGVTLIPLLLNPAVTFIFRIDCREEYIKRWTHVKQLLRPKKILKTKAPCCSTSVCVPGIEMKTWKQRPVNIPEN